MAEPREFTIDIGDIELCVFEWSGDSDPVLLLHATGFHSRCWNEVVRQLPGQHIYAVDLRFHGRSGSVGTVDWQVLVDDICVLLKELALENVIGVGHSIGGHLITRSAAAQPQYFKQLLLIDPVIMDPETYTRNKVMASELAVEDHPVSRRKNRWHDADEMFQRFVNKPPFNSWQTQVLRDYCDYALHPENEQGYRQLLCDPINEASVYMTLYDTARVSAELATLRIPTTVLRASRGSGDLANLAVSPTWPELAAQLHCSREFYLPELNHFIPMQDPAMVARRILEAQQNDWQGSQQ